MMRVSRDVVRQIVAIAIRVRPMSGRRKLDLDTDRQVEALADDLANRIMGSAASETVLLRPNMVGPGHAPWRGKWDIDEPHPHPDVPFSEHG